MDLEGWLGHHRRVGLDTLVAIYALEQNPRFARPAEAVLHAVLEGRLMAVASARPKPISPNVGDWIAIGSRSKAQDQAWALMKVLQEPEAQLACCETRYAVRRVREGTGRLCRGSRGRQGARRWRRSRSRALRH